MRIFLAGASGAIGRRLTPLLLAAGHQVTGTTRSADKAAELKARGVEPLVVDVFDAAALRDAVASTRPDVVVHQLTDLPQVADPTLLRDALARNSRLRIEGTANLVAAARAAGARRLVAQSIAFAYADGPEPHAETDPLVSGEGDAPSAVTGRGVRALEAAVLGARHRRHRAALRPALWSGHLEYPECPRAPACRCGRASGAVGADQGYAGHLQHRRG